MGRVLGLDYGEKRIGLALSDPMRIIASPHSVLQRTTLERDLDELVALIAEREVEEIVCGWPRRTDDGTKSEMAGRVEVFAERLRVRVDLPIHFIDEAFTSHEANAILRQGTKSRDWKKRKQMVDMIAAQIILRTFLERR